jgi:hypothetical protein
MNNMLEYMTGGQCYKCGGKVRYPDGGENMQGQEAMPQGQSPVASMGMQQPQRQPSTIDANAKELMRFLLAQLEKGTSERILRKTLTDSGLKAEQADELLSIAKQEFDKTIQEGEYSTSAEEQQMQMMARQQQMAQQQMMGQAGPNAGMDPSMMAMNQQTDQSQTADAEMEARFGGSMRRLRRMNMGGTGVDGFTWNDTTGAYMPTSTTANVMSAGAGPVNIGASTPATQQQLMQQSNAANQNAISKAKSEDAQRNAEMGYYDQIINTANTNRQTNFGNRMTAMEGLHTAMLQGQLPWQQPKAPVNNNTQPIGTNTQPELNQGTTQDQVNLNARFGGLTRFVNGGLKKYGPGGTEDGCPEGYYKDNNGDCQKIFGSGQAQAEYQKQVVDFWNKSPSQDPNSNRAAMMSFDEWQQTGEGKAQDQMYNDMITSPKAFQKYVNDYSTANTGKVGAQPHMSYDDWKAQQLGTTNNQNNNANSNNNNNSSAPIDPRLTNSPYIVRTDKNKIANLDNNWVNKALAVGSNIGSAQSLGYAGAFGPYLKMLMGATGAISSAALGAKKIFAGDKRTVYDDKGNVFVYDNKRSFKNAGRDNQQGSGSGENTPNTGVNEDIPKGHFLQTNVDKNNNPVGIDRQGRVVSYDHPDRNQIQNKGTAAERKYTDDVRLDENLFLAGKTEKDFKEQGPALFGSNIYGSQQELADDYKNAGFFGKMRQRNQFKRDQLWDLPQEQDQIIRRMNPDAFPQDNSTGNAGAPQQSPVINNAGPVANDPNAQTKLDYMQSQLQTQQEGGEWNPFVDNRRKLRISMPMYNNGGRVDNESFPYTQAEWAQKKGKALPLSQQDVADYDNYVKNFNTTPATNTTNNTTNNTTTPTIGSSNANNALSNNPNANMVDTKKYTIETGDPLGARVAQNLYSGLAGWNAGLNEIQGNKRIRDIQKKRQNIGNSMEMAAVNPINMYGSWQLNANQGSNYDLANQGATQDWQTTLNAKYGGSIYRKGGTYMVSPQELQAIIAMGGEVEFLD